MAQRQEQEPARSDVVEVAPDVLRLELPIHMPGLGHVNCYALIDGEGAAVVDPGLPGPASWRAMTDRLRRADLKVSDVHTVVVTHSHPDHFGGAARFAKESGARIVAHRSFSFGAPVQVEDTEVSVDDLAAQSDAEPSDPPQPNWSGKTPWGGERPRPPFRSRMRWHAMRWLGGSFIPNITHRVEHGDVLELAGRDWFVLHTPGHTADHFCIHDPDTGTFLAGDHVLPTITPHISGISHSPDPLESFFYSLDRVAEISGVKEVLPAHGHPFGDLRKRTEAIKRHHQERLEKIRMIAREIGPASVQAFSERLFKPRSWGPMAESETYAHLEHMRHKKQAERHTDSDARFIYEI